MPTSCPSMKLRTREVHIRILMVVVVRTSRPVTFFTTHLCPPPDGCTANQRQAQVDDLKLWAAGKAAPHVIAGDFNALPGASEISGPTGMTAAYVDLWTEAVNGGKATPA